MDYFTTIVEYKRDRTWKNKRTAQRKQKKKEKNDNSTLFFQVKTEFIAFPMTLLE